MKIKSAAILHDGRVYEGFNHSQIILRMVKEEGIAPPVHGEQGFVTDTGEFVSRQEAAKIALANGQIQRLQYHDTDLFSEDLNYPVENTNQDPKE